MNYSYVIYRMVSFTMILSDCSAFQGCSIFQNQICRRKPYTIY